MCFNNNIMCKLTLYYLRRKTMNMMKTNETGRSMIEMLGVLAIIGVLSVGGIAGYSKAMNKFKTNKVADNVSMIVTNIRTLYAQQNNYAGLNNITAIQMGVVPDELGTDTTSGTLTNAFLGGVNIGTATVTSLDAGTSGANRGFFLTMNGLTKEACVTLAANDWGSGYSAGYVGMTVSGSVQTSYSTSFAVNCTDRGAAKWCASQGPMQVSQAATGCSATGNTNSITWVFY